MGGVLSEFLNDMRVDDALSVPHKEESEDEDIEIYQWRVWESCKGGSL